MSKYTDHENAADVIREENTVLLDSFVSWLAAKNLSDATVKNHRDNIDFYINDFLLYEEPQPASEGVDEVVGFLGHWFIRKAMWASETSIRSNAASLKKFYDFMLERGEVSPGAVREMKDRIKVELPDCVATLKRYDDPSVDIEDVWPW